MGEIVIVAGLCCLLFGIAADDAMKSFDTWRAERAARRARAAALAAVADEVAGLEPRWDDGIPSELRIVAAKRVGRRTAGR